MIEILALDFFSLRLGEIFYPLQRFPVILNEHSFTVSVNPLISIHSRTLHMPVTCRNAIWREKKSNHMHRFRSTADEIKDALSILTICYRIWFESMNEIRKLHASRIKNTFRLFPTRSQFPSSV